MAAGRSFMVGKMHAVGVEVSIGGRQDVLVESVRASSTLTVQASSRFALARFFCDRGTAAPPTRAHAPRHSCPAQRPCRSELRLERSAANAGGADAPPAGLLRVSSPDAGLFEMHAFHPTIPALAISSGANSTSNIHLRQASARHVYSVCSATTSTLSSRGPLLMES